MKISQKSFRGLLFDSHCRLWLLNYGVQLKSTPIKMQFLENDLFLCKIFWRFVCINLALYNFHTIVFICLLIWTGWVGRYLTAYQHTHIDHFVRILIWTKTIIIKLLYAKLSKRRLKQNCNCWISTKKYETRLLRRASVIILMNKYRQRHATWEDFTHALHNIEWVENSFQDESASVLVWNQLNFFMDIRWSKTNI